MRIAIIGTGYVGLVTGACFAENGNRVICVDNNQEKLATLKRGEVPIFEPGLEDFVEKNTKADRLTFTDDLGFAVTNSDVIFFCLPTPPMEDGSADLKYVLEVAEAIGPLIDDYKVIVNKSTVPVGTTYKISEIINKKTNHEFDVVSNPEFLREGSAVWDFMKPDRVVVGTNSLRAKEMMLDLYRGFVRADDQILVMDPKSSEITKYAANSFLATKVSFINEIANFCQLVGADIEQVSHGIGLDSRIGAKFLKAGIGYGGSCFPKDIIALQNTGRAYDYEFTILDTIRRVNEKQREVVIDLLQKEFDDGLQNKQIAIWGLAFKADTDDVREAPSIRILEKLTETGVNVVAYDPEAMENMQKFYNFPITYASDIFTAVSGADALLILTDWGEFKNPDLNKIKGLMNRPLIVDGRNIYDLQEMKTLGFHYISIGRPEIYN